MKKEGKWLQWVTVSTQATQTELIKLNVNMFYFTLMISNYMALQNKILQLMNLHQVKSTFKQQVHTPLLWK